MVIFASLVDVERKSKSDHMQLKLMMTRAEGQDSDIDNH